MTPAAYLHRVQYYETDAMQIVHHSNYIRFFEEARISYLEQLGISYGAVERSGYVVPVLSASAEYKSMSRFGETLAISVQLENCTGIRFTFSYRVTDAVTGVLRAIGKTTHCYLKDGQPVNLKRALPDHYRLLTQQMGSASEIG